MLDRERDRKMKKIFDTHAHYDDSAFEDDRKKLIAGLLEHGIGYVVNVGASIFSSKQTLELVKEYPFFYGAVGVHPSEVGELTEEGIAFLRKAALKERVVAIGEIGLDYYWDKSEREVQKKWFVRQLELAREVELPVIIHSRDAAQDTMDILKEQKGTNGFGYDPIFFTDEKQCAMAELKDYEKAQVSHRAKALMEVLSWFTNQK